MWFPRRSSINAAGSTRNPVTAHATHQALSPNVQLGGRTFSGNSSAYTDWSPTNQASPKDTDATTQMPAKGQNVAVIPDEMSGASGAGSKASSTDVLMPRRRFRFSAAGWSGAPCFLDWSRAFPPRPMPPEYTLRRRIHDGSWPNRRGPLRVTPGATESPTSDENLNGTLNYSTRNPERQCRWKHVSAANSHNQRTLPVLGLPCIAAELWRFPCI